MAMFRKHSASSGYIVLACIIGLLLAACATPQFDARLKMAYDIHTATTQSVTAALDAQLISSRDAEAYRDIAQNARLVLDSARELKDVDTETAEGKLRLAEQILLQLQAYLREREARQ
jgi:hypothetical protein